MGNDTFGVLVAVGVAAVFFGALYAMYLIYKCCYGRSVDASDLSEPLVNRCVALFVFTLLACAHVCVCVCLNAYVCVAIIHSDVDALTSCVPLSRCLCAATALAAVRMRIASTLRCGASSLLATVLSVPAARRKRTQSVMD